MRVHRISIRRYRGVDSLTVDLDPTGVTVIEGPNGSGKSSLAEALSVVLTTQETSRSQAVRALQPVGQDVPTEIEVEIESGEYRFALSKSFNKRPAATLNVTQPSPETSVGGAAHDRANEILDATGVDRQLMRALWVRQGREMAQVALKECPALGRALDIAAGSVPSGAVEQTVLDRARQEFGRYWTPGGAEAKSVGDLRRRVGQLREALESARSREQELLGQVERSERSFRALVLLREQADELRLLVAAHQRRRQEVETLASTLDLAQQRLTAVTAEAEVAVGRQAVRAALAEQVVEIEKRCQASADSLSRLEDDMAPIRERHEDAEASLRLAVTACDQTAALRLVRAADATALRQTAELIMLRARLQAVGEAVRRRASARAVMVGSRVTDASLEELRELASQVREAAARLAAAGATVRFTARCEISISGDGTTRDLRPGQTESYSIADALARFELGDQMSVQVEPGSGAAGERDRHAECVLRFAQALRQLGVESLEQAVVAVGELQQAARELAQAEGQLSENLRGLTQEGLEGLIATNDAEVQLHLKSRLWAEPIPESLDAAQALLAEAEALDQHAREERTRSQQSWDAYQGPFEQIQARFHAASTAIAHDREELERAQIVLNQARLLEPDEALLAAVEKTAQTVRQVAGEFEVGRQTLAALDPQSVRQLADNAAAALRGLEVDIATQEGEGIRADAQIEVLAPAGLFDLTQARARDLELAESELERVARLAAGAKTLLESLERARSQAQRAYLEPLREQIESRGRTVFGPEFTVELDFESLQVARCRLDRSWLEWDKLSTGTQEQLAIIARLAAAALAAPGGGVPLIIDDALGYSDEERLERMCAVLGRAGHDVQVIVLTCMPRRYRQIGGAKTLRIDPHPGLGGLDSSPSSAQGERTFVAQPPD